MKYELDFLRRGYLANMLRRRASELRGMAEDRTASATQLELREEATFCEAEARKLDDAQETTEQKAPTIPYDPNRRTDIDAIDGKVVTIKQDGKP